MAVRRTKSVDDEVMIVSAERRLPIFNERYLEVEDENDVVLKQPAIKSVSEATSMAEQLRDFLSSQSSV